MKPEVKTFGTIFAKQREKETGVVMGAIQCEELGVIWGCFRTGAMAEGYTLTSLCDIHPSTQRRRFLPLFLP